MIVAYLTNDTRSLWVCSFTSRSWYSAAVPHLHHTLVTRTRRYIYGAEENKKIRWPEPLRMASKSGFLPFITRVFISGQYRYSYFLCAKEFDDQTQREFSALTNVLELSIDYLYIPSFIPRIRQYFGQFSPTLRSLTLTNARGSDRQIVSFVGLFPHLRNLELTIGLGYLRGTAGHGLTLITPPLLRGQPTAHDSRGSIGKAMFDLFREVRFHHMDLRGLGLQHLLYACPNTLETLKLDVTDICGENPLRKTRKPRLTILQVATLIEISICLETGLFVNSKLQPSPSFLY